MSQTEAFNWKYRAEDIHNHRPQRQRKPIIGITGNYGAKGCELADGYWQSVLAAGGSPLIIPPYEDPEAMAAALEGVDALLLSGGGDLNPLFVGEEPSPALHSITPQRDEAELQLIRMALDMQLPILGICRGIQMLAVAMDGSVHQDIREGMPKDTCLIKHSQDLPREWASHSVSINNDTLLYNILGNRDVAVNSFHHQAVKEAGPHLRVCATAPDGMIEAVESCEGKPIVGVQWHPECFILRGDRSMLPLFGWLVDEARLYRHAVEVHQRIVTLDSHCDTPMKFHTDEERLTTLPRMCYGHLDATIMVAYLPQRGRSDEELNAATQLATNTLAEIDQYISENAEAACLATTPNGVREAKQQGKRAIVKGIENGYALGKDQKNVERFARQGIAYITLCHNGDNDLCDSARGNSEHGGLSAFGKEVVKEMNRCGLMVDLSHAAKSSFWNALELSRTPIICSHSSCRALTNHVRNLTDNQMRALANAGGVMQVTLYEGFIQINGKATINEAIRHIEHAIQIMGIEHVGIGTDFDGDGGVPGVAHAGELMNLTRELLRRGHTERELRLLWGENLMRVWQQALDYKETKE